MNSSKKLIKKAHEDLKKKREREYHINTALLIITTFPAFEYVLILLLMSVYDNSTNFSFILSIFSLCITVAFEGYEWIIYFNTKDGGKKITNGKFQKLIAKYFKYYSPLLLAQLIVFVILILITVFFALNNFFKFVKISEQLIVNLPNVITTITLLVYFISYTFRSILTRRNKYFCEKI